MPWELEFVDGKTDRCTIIPISKDNNFSFNRVEYLKLYPYLDISNDNLWINEDINSYISFRRWMNGDSPIKRNS